MNIQQAADILGIAAPKQGNRSEDFTIDGVVVEITFDLIGHRLPGTHDDPEELPDIEIRTVNVGGTELSGAEAYAWDERLDLSTLLEERVATYDYQE
jgi:hypothetical protein